MEEDQQFCLRWNNHQSTLISVFDTLFDNGKLVDCTLAAEGQFVKAHKVVLSACSPYFATLLTEQYDKHPIFILKDVKYQELRAMMDYMYRGEVNISQDQLAALLKAAESLQIKGLSDNRSGGDNSQKTSSAEHKHVSVPGKANVGYTLEQTKRARLGPSSAELHDVAGSREGSSSPTGTRKRRKIRRRSVDNVMADNHENSNSSQSIQINSSVPSSNVTGTISTSIATGPAVGGASSLPQGAGNLIASNVTKKTENVSKMGSNNDAITAADNEQNDEHDKQIGTVKKDQNHKRSSKVINLNEKETDIVIEPKSEYDDDGNDETVEDLTLDDEDMGLEDLDQAAGPSHGGEGSSQGYAQWQVDRSQDEVFMAAQEAQQRDPQGNAAYWTILETVPYSVQSTGSTTTHTTTTADQENLMSGATVVVQIPAETVGMSGSTIQYTIPNKLSGKQSFQVIEQITPEDVEEKHLIVNSDEEDVVHSMLNLKDTEKLTPIRYTTTTTAAVRKISLDSNKTEDEKTVNAPKKTTNRDSTQCQYVCNVCGKYYKIKGSLKRHKNYECGVTPGLSCEYCPHKSKYKSDLRKHIVQKHAHLEPDLMM